LTEAELEADAVEDVLRKAGPNETNWAKAFRTAALHAHLPTARQLLAFQADEESNAALPNYRRDLFHEVRRLHRDGLKAFEFDTPA
jgi:hypothetical protein